MILVIGSGWRYSLSSFGQVPFVEAEYLDHKRESREGWWCGTCNDSPSPLLRAKIILWMTPYSILFLHLTASAKNDLWGPPKRAGAQDSPHPPPPQSAMLASSFCNSGLRLNLSTSSIALQQHSHTPAASLHCYSVDVAGARDRAARQLSVWACGLNNIVVA